MLTVLWAFIQALIQGMNALKIVNIVYKSMERPKVKNFYSSKSQTYSVLICYVLKEKAEQTNTKTNKTNPYQNQKRELSWNCTKSDSG